MNLNVARAANCDDHSDLQLDSRCFWHDDHRIQRDHEDLYSDFMRPGSYSVARSV